MISGKNLTRKEDQKQYLTLLCPLLPKLTPTDVVVQPTPTPSINRPVNNSGLNAELSVSTVRIISSHPMVYGTLQRMMDNLRPK